jgi:hypothetical protein
VFNFRLPAFDPDLAKSTAGYPVVDFSTPPLFSDSRWRLQKSSTGYPVLDFRPPAFDPDLAKSTAGYPAVDFSSQPLFSDSRWRLQKSSSGYPGLDFRLPPFDPDLAKLSWDIPCSTFSSSPCLPTPGAVSKDNHGICVLSEFLSPCLIHPGSNSRSFVDALSSDHMSRVSGKVPCSFAVLNFRLPTSDPDLEKLTTGYPVVNFSNMGHGGGSKSQPRYMPRLAFETAPGAGVPTGASKVNRGICRGPLAILGTGGGCKREPRHMPWFTSDAPVGIPAPGAVSKVNPANKLTTMEFGRGRPNAFWRSQQCTF